MIPRIIHQTWKDNLLPPIISNIRSENISLLRSKGYEFKFWTDDDILELIKIHYPEFYNIYRLTKTGVQRGDISRIILIYHFGGIYIDLDVLILRDFDELIDMYSDLFYITYEPYGQTLTLYNSDKYICNAFFAANKNNRFLYILLRCIPEKINKYGVNIFQRFDVFGGSFIKHIIEKEDNKKEYINDICVMDDRELIFPINDLKFDGLSFTNHDWTCVLKGEYPINTIMVHYWIHGDFESKILLNTFKVNKSLNIHENIYNFFKTLYPNIAKKIENI
jgi:hypothetical protein